MKNTLITPQSTKIFDAIRLAGAEARFVGGCVRDFLSEKPINDIDIAVNKNPDEVTNILSEIGIHVIPTGILHGTVTAIVDNIPYEITTLRLDKETDGRHASVEFTTDWEIDAGRRDFTFNALYMDADGKIYDYFNGQEDLKNGIVRFIGNAEDRINEDYLRILRYFRFVQRYGKGHIEFEIEACNKLHHNLSKISIERIWAELSKILEGKYDVCRIMFDMCNILDDIIPGISGYAFWISLSRLIDLEASWDKPSAMRRLACVVSHKLESNDIDDFVKKWKFSNEEVETLQNCFSTKINEIMCDTAAYDMKDGTAECCYRFGKEATLDYALVRAATIERKWHRRFNHIIRWDDKTLPLSGNDLIKMGIPQGKQLGVVIRKVEDWWIASCMEPTGKDCKRMAKDVWKRIK